MIYKFKQGNTFKGIDAQVVGDELERIRRANDGKLESTEVVRWAAEPDSPIHNAFTWDNEKAAEAYRLDEARSLIKSVVIVREQGPPQPAFWNVAVSVPSADAVTTEHYYQSADVIAQNPKEFNSALTLMLRELASAQKGLEQLRLLAPRGTKTAISRATGQVKAAQTELTGIH